MIYHKHKQPHQRFAIIFKRSNLLNVNIAFTKIIQNYEFNFGIGLVSGANDGSGVGVF
jgi:hypothetical protein